MNRPAYMPALDGLRGLAILMVIAHNGQLLETPEMAGAVKAAYLMFNIGWVGVQLFFVLSGFLITGILLDTINRPKALRHFIARRALRIFPLYYGLLLLLFVILPALGLQPEIYKAQAPYQGWLWAYLSNWTDPLGFGPKALPHFWSLAVEEQFYLIWPLLIYAVRTPAAVARLSVLVALGSMGSRALMLNAGTDTNVVYAWTNCRIDALALGALAAACWRIPACTDWFKANARLSLAAVSLLFLGVAAWTQGFPRASYNSMVVGYSVLALTFMAIICMAAWRDSEASQGGHHPALWHALLKLPPLQRIGKYSYGMYVFHKPLHDLFSRPALHALDMQTEGMLLNASMHLLGLTLVSFGAAWLSYHFYEVHFLNLKRRFA